MPIRSAAPSFVSPLRLAVHARFGARLRRAAAAAATLLGLALALALAPAPATAYPVSNPCGTAVDTGSSMQVSCGFTGGEQTFVVPAGVTSVHVSASGATGGQGQRIWYEYNSPLYPGALGASASGDIAVTPGSILYVSVGGQGGIGGGGGFNGGGNAGDGNSGSGGGASDVRTCSSASCTTLGNESDPRLLVAAGGGGCGAFCYAYNGSGRGGEGGLPSPGTDGQGDFNYPYGSAGGGLGGTQSAGGAGGRNYSNPQAYNGPSAPGTAGTAGQGGNGGVGAASGAGGGGGYFGGGGGGGNSDPQVPSSDGSGGGGGSSYAGSAIGASYGPAARGNGSVTIGYIPAPKCAAVSATVGRNTPVQVHLSCTNYDVSAQAFAVADEPSHGTVSGLDAATGEATYTPEQGYVGSDSFTYRSTNAVGDSNTATVSLTVLAPPTCAAASAVTRGATAVQVALACTGRPDDPIAYATVGTPAHGALSGLDAAAGTVIYTPEQGYGGPDSFTYEGTDSGGASSAATATITVDATDPTVALTTPSEGASYVQDADVKAAYSCADEAGGSGLTTCAGTTDDGDSIDTSHYGSQAFAVTATDVAGNTHTVSVHYSVLDVTKPAGYIIVPADGETYDQGSSLIAQFSCQDEYGGSNIATCDGSTPWHAPVDTSTIGSFLYTLTVTDNAGNTRTVTSAYHVRRAPDTTDPTVALDVPADGGVYGRGEVHDAAYSCADTGGSDLASCTGTAPTGDPIDTAALGKHSFAVTATDNDGNTHTETHTYSVRDVTYPTITISPGDDATYAQGSVAGHVSFSCADEAGGSGLDTCEGSVANGTPIDTSHVGRFTISVTATDMAGNRLAERVHYSIGDVSKPQITVAAPAAGASLAYGSTVRPAFTCDDGPAGSGVASCEASETQLLTHSPGSHHLTITATDHAGNTARLVVMYRVLRPPVRLSELTVTPRAFTPRGRTATVPRGTQRTARIRWNLTRDATLTVTLTRLTSAGTLAAGAFHTTTTRRGFAGHGSIVLTGRRAGRPLPAGRWRVTVRATDSDGNLAPARHVNIRLR